jgi:hypothetical protein
MTLHSLRWGSFCKDVLSYKKRPCKNKSLKAFSVAQWKLIGALLYFKFAAVGSDLF